MIRYIISSVGAGLKLERHCPHCGRFGGNIHGGINYRAVSDIKISSIPQRRNNCPKDCGGIFGTVILYLDCTPYYSKISTILLTTENIYQEARYG